MNSGGNPQVLEKRCSLALFRSGITFPSCPDLVTGNSLREAWPAFQDQTGFPRQCVEFHFSVIFSTVKHQVKPCAYQVKFSAFDFSV